MPGKSRFGSGSLLGPVAPLPDDDPPPKQTPASEQPDPPEPTTTPEPPAPPPAAEPEPEQAPGPDPEPTPRAAEAGRRGRPGPPSTLRINEVAGEALWAAFLEAKTADPFLSFRQFASGVVLDGLRRAEQRAKRRR